MTYLDWNNKLVERFFNRGPEKKVFLCVTVETLAEISGMPPLAAIDDFVQAVIDGPEWTRIPGCRTIPSKAHNCLHPDPNWRYRGDLQIERHQLSGHIDWRNFSDWNYQCPPYVAYLCLLVLAWTERDDNFSGLDFYGPLNALLRLNNGEGITTQHLRACYTYGNCNLSINALWQDLESWSFYFGQGVCYLPRFADFEHSYVFLPKYFGLFTAADLRKLDSLYFAMDEAMLVDPVNLPSPTRFVEIVLAFPNLRHHLSTACIEQLKNDKSAERAAMGALLLAKYRNWDGTVDDDAQSGEPVHFRGALLLRYMKHGVLQSVVKLRTQNAVEKLSLEAGREYAIENATHATLVWPGFSSPWFKPMNFLPEDQMSQAVLECADLGLIARMTSRPNLVMDNRHLPHHLQGGFLECDEVEPGCRYLLLCRGSEQPNLNGVALSRNHGYHAPEGFSCWWMDVPTDPDRANWPSALPPLAEILRDRQPRIRLASPCRTVPREPAFLVGFPVTVSCSRAGLEPFLLPCRVPSDIRINPLDGNWILSTSHPCVVTLSLRQAGTNQTIDGSNLAVTFVDVDSVVSDQNSCHDLFSDLHQHIEQYPLARIQFESGSPVGREAGQIKRFLAEDPPTAKLVEACSGCSLFLDDSKCDQEARFNDVCGSHRLEAKLGEVVLDAVAVELVETPELQIKGLSEGKDNPTAFFESVCATLHCNSLAELDYEIVGADCGRGRIRLPHTGVLTTAVGAGLVFGRTYEVRFVIGRKVVGSRWIRRNTQERHGGKPISKAEGRSTGANPFDAALRGLEVRK